MMRKISLLLFFLTTFSLIGVEQTTRLRFKKDEDKSSTGYFQSQWKNPEKALVELRLYAEESSTSRLIYRGTGESTFLSGLPDGTYHLQLRLTGQEPLLAQSTISVTHYSIQQATAFLIVGAFLFISICFFLYFWHSKTEQTRGLDG